MQRVIYALFAVIVSMSFDLPAMYAVVQPTQSSLTEKGLFRRGDRGHRGKHGKHGKHGEHGKHGRRGKRGKAGANGATGATGAGGSFIDAFGSVFTGAESITMGNVVPFAIQGVLSGVTYNGTDTYTIQTAGLYRVDYSFSAGGIARIEAFLDTGGGFIAIPGSGTDIVSSTYSLVYEANMQLNAGDQLRVQVTSGTLNIVFGTFSVTRLN